MMSKKSEKLLRRALGPLQEAVALGRGGLCHQADALTPQQRAKLEKETVRAERWLTLVKTLLKPANPGN
jgi:hypothetical protein